MKTPDFMSYERYKKKKNDTSKSGMLTAVTTFFAALLLFTAVAKSLSPNVDVSIGHDSQTEVKDTGLGVKKFIDERLKMIQMEDNSAGVSIQKDNRKVSNYGEAILNSASQQEAEEKINLPSKSNKQNNDDVTEEDMVQPVVKTPPRPKSSKDVTTPFESQRISKVYVGRYASVEQAKVAQEILMDAGLGITPFVKDMGGFYTLQVGSYSSRAKAEGLASELQRNSFPARLVQE